MQIYHSKGTLQYMTPHSDAFGKVGTLSPLQGEKWTASHSAVAKPWHARLDFNEG